VTLLFLLVLHGVCGLAKPRNKVKLPPKSENSPSVAAFLMNKLFNTPLHDEENQKGLDWGVGCAACTMVVAIIEQMAYLHEKPVDTIMDMLCGYFPSGFKEYCIQLVDQYGEDIIRLLEAEETPDQVCNEIDICVNKTCQLYPPPGKYYANDKKPKPLSEPRVAAKLKQKKVKENSSVRETPIDWIIDLVNRVFNSHEPLVDMDGDYFSASETLRGSKWRGKDCNDFAADVYPGRLTTTRPAEIDHDCNGIYGIDSVTGKSYEELWCKDTNAMGVILLGDSAGAHFHIPPSFITPSLINETTYQSLLDIVFDEGDWPQMSAATGYEVTPWVGAPEGRVSSGYLKGRDANLCSHRDYQNVAVNGARSGAMADHIMYSMHRNKTIDRPVVLSYALVGNDVCNGHPGTASMTTPQEMHDNAMRVLQYLGQQLPMGSHVVLFGLVDGRILYDVLHDKIHPIGSTRNDVTYAKFYDYFNCLGISPCFGWMNSDPYWRNQTTIRAFQLNDALKEIVQNYTHYWPNFDLTYLDNLITPIIKIWQDQGGEAWQLIEPVDGFHPNQIANYLLGEYEWTMLKANYSYLIPQLNPNNAKIKAKFGNQGGH